MTKTYFMARGRILRIQGGADHNLQVQSGGLWVTQEGDRRDYYLAPGSSFRVSGKGLVLAQATCPTTVALSGTQPLQAKSRTFRARLARFWSSLYAPHARPTTVSL
jgi:hypothetical protein